MTSLLTRPAAPSAGPPSLNRPAGRRPLPQGLTAAIWATSGLALATGFLTDLGGARGFGLAWLIAMLVPLASLVFEGRRKATDRFVTVLVVTAFMIAVIPLVSILSTVIAKGAPVLSAEFFTTSMRNVVGEGGGIQHVMLGTLIITGFATLISVPIGLFAAIYLIEYSDGGPTARGLRFLTDVMTGIPSIVAGLFAYALFVLIFGEGIRMGLGGAVALSVLMIPVVIRSSEEMLKLVPNELREASWALGVSRWRTIVKVVLPTALAGIVTGVTLAIARVIGETAPLLIIAGMTDSVNTNPLDGRMATLPVFAYSALMNPGVPPQPSIDRAWGAALTLLIIVMLLNLVARGISYLFSPAQRR